MLSQRIGFGSLMIAGCVGLVWADAWLSQQLAPLWWPELPMNPLEALYQGALTSLVVAGLIGWAAVELGRLLRQGGYRPITWWAGLVSFWMAVSPWVASQFWRAEPWQMLCRALVVATAGALVAVIVRRRIVGAAGDVASTVFIVSYVGLFGSYAVRLRVEVGGWAGAWLLLYFIAVVKVADIAAYFVGSAVGRYRLAPRLSPGKTIEGFVGALVSGGAAGLALARLGAIIAPAGGERLWPGGLQAIVFGVIMGFVGQVGDLCESLLKRDAIRKDSGRAIPGFGGVLDLIDSPLLAAPVAYALLVAW
ncbi:MAG: phosphatidate cytidylyltransferase [Phycisphaerae bacterium]